MTAYLLDVNVMLALCDPQHVHHEAAHHWFQNTGRRAWATCPLVENGFVRVASHPSYPSSMGTASTVTEILRKFCADKHHHFWANSVTLRDHVLFPLTPTVTHAHVTDIYLLGLAVHHGGKLATFDQHIPASVVKDGATALELVTAE
jgi:uncharacterized protein